MSASSVCRKRKPPPEVIAVDGPGEKRQKLNPCMIQHCFRLLDELENHPISGQFFNQTYDDRNNPVYDTVTRNPMDLGIIRFNLQNGTYFRIQEFEADLRLAFDNAMLYMDSPLSNLRQMAEEVNRIFQKGSKTLKENFPDEENLMLSKGERPIVGSNSECRDFKLKLTDSEEKIGVPKPKQNCVRKLARKNLRNEKRAQGSIQCRHSLCRGAGKCSSCGCINCQCNLPSDSKNATYEKGVAIGCPIETRQKMEPCMIQQSFALLEELKKHPVAGRLFNLQKLDDQELNGVLQARWTSLKDYWQNNAEKPKVSRVRSNSSDEVEVPKETKTIRIKSISNASNKQDSQCKSRETSKYDRDCASDNVCLGSQLTVPAAVKDEASGQVLITAPNPPTIHLQKSPKKALRATMLKCRFKDIISKAQQRGHDDKADQVKKQHEKEKSDRRLRKEKAKVEDRIRPVEAAGKKIREREREAARTALQKMENSAGIKLNLEIQKELEILCGGSLPGANPLHQLGLFLKDKYSEDEIEGDEADMYEDIEEGEIVP